MKQDNHKSIAHERTLTRGWHLGVVVGEEEVDERLP